MPNAALPLPPRSKTRLTLYCWNKFSRPKPIFSASSSCPCRSLSSFPCNARRPTLPSWNIPKKTPPPTTPRNPVPTQRPQCGHHHQTIRPLNLPAIGHVQLQTNRALLREDYRKSTGFPCKANPCPTGSSADAQCGVCRATPAVNKRHSNLKET